MDSECVLHLWLLWTGIDFVGIRAQCNLGAKNHAVILPDCDMDQALNQLVGAAFGTTYLCFAERSGTLD